MKRSITLSILLLAFITNAMAWEPEIKETHWFGVYEYVDYPYGFDDKVINWSGNYIESIIIVKSATGQDPRQRPKTSFYSWLDHKLRFSVANTNSWGLDETNNSAYNKGQGLKNITNNPENFVIHDLKLGDSYSIQYYENNKNQPTEVSGSGVGNITIEIPGQAVIRRVIITMKEYQKATMEVKELTQAEQTQFGGFGYRYSFTGSGVLEDKRGAVPYITMRFGADNDMTFVRPLSNINYQYGSLEETPAKLYAKNFGGDVVEATANSNNEYTVSSGSNAQFGWDTQFWIAAPYDLPQGQKFKVDFWYKADKAANVSTQIHGTPSQYLYWGALGDLSFTTEWQHYEGGEITVTSDMNGMQSIAFNLNDDLSNATTFYFKDITLSVPGRTITNSSEDYGAASIIDASNTLNPYTDNLQYRLTYKVDNQTWNRYTQEETRERLIGKEWSIFTAQHDLNVDASSPNPYGDDPGSVVFGDIFNSIWPLCGNYFYFFPEVNGKLVIDYYCEGEEEVPAFWYKQREDGSLPSIYEQPSRTNINLNAAGRTNGTNHYSLIVNVEKGGVYYLCSLPTNQSHEHPIIRLKSYAFIPSFRVEPLYKVVNNATDVANGSAEIEYAAEVLGGPYSGMNTDNLTGTYIRNAEQEPRVKCLGNVESAKAKVFTRNGRQYLGFYDIHFKEGTNANGETYNPGGAVVAHIDCEYGKASFVLTIAYDAANAKWGKVDGKDTRVAYSDGGEEVKHWDFYSNTNWDLGKYGEDDGTRYDASNPSAWLAKSKLFKEVHKADGLTADWSKTFVNLQEGGQEPIFKSVYDMEADNADMIHETAGLVIMSNANELGIYNENDAPTSSFQDRYIGFMNGGKLIIPRLKKDDRVVIKMGAFGNSDDAIGNKPATLTINNALDAKGNAISGDYVIGGSIPFNDETSPANTLPHGEYHFIVANTSNSLDNDFYIEVKEADLLKIYSIDIYRNGANDNQDILTENSVTGMEPELLFTDDDEDSKDMTCYLRYSGYKEISAINDVDQVRGNLDLQTSSFTTDDASDEFPFFTVTTTMNKGDFGSFRANMAVKTTDAANTYVTDYAPGCLAVDYLETKPYPYTWDFTDLVPFGEVDNDIASEEDNANLLADYRGWTDGVMRNAPETEPGILFANGGQIYASDQMFAESAGIGLKRSAEQPEDAKLLNNSVSVTADGLVLNSTNNEYHKLVIPKVDANAAVYVRATPISGATLIAQCNGGNFDKTINVDDDVIYVKKITSEQDVELALNGMTIKKMAVSTDDKKLDQNGWASESREHVIDPDLTQYLTGANIQTLFVSNVVTGEPGEGGQVNLSEPITGKVIRAMEDDETGACLLYCPDGQVSIIDNGFHLFVPDMHDHEGDITDNAVGGEKDVTTEEESLLKAKISEGIADGDDDYTYYVLSYKYYETGKEGEGVKIGSEGFYRVKDGGISTNGHKAYLPLLTADVKKEGSSAGFSIVFSGSYDGITEMSSNANASSIYTINGQKLSNMPTTTGLYIVNGKKVVIK